MREKKDQTNKLQIYLKKKQQPTHTLHFYSKTFPADTAGTPNTPNLPDCGMFKVSDGFKLVMGKYFRLLLTGLRVFQMFILQIFLVHIQVYYNNNNNDNYYYCCCYYS